MKFLTLIVIGFTFVACSPEPEFDPNEPTPGLEFTLINNGTAYSVSKGTANAAMVVIPAVYNGRPVTEIADSGFTSYTNMTSIIIPNGVTKIGSYAFFHCDNLTSVVIPAVTTNIGISAFQNCGNLNAIYYGGADSAAWSAKTIGSANESLINAERYYYSETNPGTALTHWRFVNGQPAVWNFIITTQPADVINVFVGNVDESLIVEASVTEGSALSYQWYRNTTNSNVGGTIITGATNPEYTLPITLTVGTHYYFCQVSTTNDAGPPIRTNVSTVNVSAFPVIIINTQPAATTNLFVGDINESLSIEAGVSDGTEVNYQWYSNTTNSNTGGNIITDATDESFTIPTTLTSGTYYYYCQVSAVDEVAIPVRSNVARVKILAPTITSSIIGIELIGVLGGSFELGRELNPAVGISDVNPVSTVNISGFYMGKYPVTQEQYLAVMGTNPSWFTPANGNPPAVGEVQERRPVDIASWYDALVFCNRLSIMEGLTPAYSISGSTNPNDWGTVPTIYNNATWDAVQIVPGSTGYRLPTEAQWEYAAKGGNGSPGNFTYSGSNDPDTVAWYSANSGSRTHEVGKKAPNSLGLYDMSGNVWEWCWDWSGSYTSVAKTDPLGASSGSFRVIRGGYWDASSVLLYSVYRSSVNRPGIRNNALGFRVSLP